MAVIMGRQIHLCSHWLCYCFREEDWNAPGLSGRSFVFLSWHHYTVVWVLSGGLPSVIVLTSNYIAVPWNHGGLSKTSPQNWFLVTFKLKFKQPPWSDLYKLYSSTSFLLSFFPPQFTSLLTLCWLCLSGLLPRTWLPPSSVASDSTFHVGQHHAALAPCPGYFPLVHFSLIMPAVAPLAVHCLPLSMECWPLESRGLASFRLSSQFL